MRATSRRTPSKPDRSTAPGVSSMMKSIPVRVSSARMLRPSRPMIRPLSSSDFSSTTETVVSTACPPATRCMQVARMLRARRSASWRVSSSTWRIRRALSWRSSSSSSRRTICTRLPGAQARHALELAHVLSLGLLEARGVVLQIPRAIVGGALTRLHLGELGVQAALLRTQPFLEPHELLTPSAQLAVAVRAGLARVLPPPARPRRDGAIGLGIVANGVVGVWAVDALGPSWPRGRNARRRHHGPARAQRKHHDRGGHRRRYPCRQQDLHVHSPPPARVPGPVLAVRPCQRGRGTRAVGASAHLRWGARDLLSGTRREAPSARVPRLSIGDGHRWNRLLPGVFSRCKQA